MKRNDVFNGSCQNYLMRNNGFYVGFNMPSALSGETTFGLPPYAKRMPYLVDKYPACPKDWLRSEGIVKSFFVPVVEGKGMWLDFNENSSHTHHIAIVVSIQGINPITGLPCNDAQLEQYIEECPKHKIKFGPDRYCSKCDYKWPKQNYICTTGTPDGFLWLDGFRSVEGIVRQYILTAEKMRGVASNIIGKNRVYAIGLSFFISKEKKPKKEVRIETVINTIYNQPSCLSPLHTPIDWQLPSNHPNDTSNPNGWDINSYWTTYDDLMPDNDSLTPKDGGPVIGGGTTSSCLCLSDATAPTKTKLFRYADVSKTYADNSKLFKSTQVVQTQKLEVGAGAKINQVVYDDPEKLDFWHDKPESIIVINYCNEEGALKIINQGEADIEGHEEAFLKDIPVGN